MVATGIYVSVLLKKAPISILKNEISAFIFLILLSLSQKFFTLGCWAIIKAQTKEVWALSQILYFWKSNQLFQVHHNKLLITLYVKQIESVFVTL